MKTWWMKYHKLPKSFPKKEAQALVEELEELLSAAEMKHAGFQSIWNDEEAVKYDPKDPTEFIKDRTRMYRHAWLISPLKELIKRYGGKQDETKIG